jgi:uncharacterized protein YkwD
MKIIPFILFSFLISSIAISQNTDLDSVFLFYKQLNNTEQRLLKFKDSDQHLKFKTQQLEIINQSRAKHNVQLVKLDILACRVANKMCQEAAKNKYVSHWNMKGEKPYHRWAIAGGYDHVSENAYGGLSIQKNEDKQQEILNIMADGHKSFMSEIAPNDGHKRNCIDKDHNYVGIGFAIYDRHFRYYEEFIDRYYSFKNIPRKARPKQTITISVKPQDGNYLYALAAFRGKKLKERNPLSLTLKGPYHDGSMQIGYSISADEIEKYRKGDWYNLPIKFDKAGIYYIQIYQSAKPHKSGITSTKGKLQASGIVIRVGM